MAGLQPPERRIPFQPSKKNSSDLFGRALRSYRSARGEVGIRGISPGIGRFEAIEEDPQLAVERAKMFLRTPTGKRVQAELHAAMKQALQDMPVGDD